MNIFEIVGQEIDRNKTRNVFVIGHIQPDGDCIGSSLGMKYLIEENYGINVVVVNQPIRRYDFLGYWSTPGSQDYSASFVIQVDNATKDRSADTAFTAADCVLKIDHHIVVDSYGHYNVEETLPSCAELIARDAIDHGLKITQDAAKCLYTGMVTDTGRFLYPGVNASTFRIAATLLDTGFDMPEIMSRINERSMDNVNYIAYAYSQLKLTEKGVLWMYIPQEVIDRFALTPDMVSQALECMRNVGGHPVSVLFADLNGRVRVEFRSDRVKLNQVAAMFGGGGHAFAAGARLDSPTRIPDVLAELDKLV